MLSTVTLVVAALSTGNKIALAAVGGAFILFALISSFVLPRRNPNFPGKHVGLFSLVGVLFLVAMITAVLVFDVEPKEATGASEPTTTQASSTTATTTTTAPSTTSTAASAGDPTAGKAVFASAGCSGCHTLKAAGATGNVGPNLDTLKPDAARVKHQVEKGGGAMPAFKGQLSAKQIADVSAFVASVDGS